jgi:hypothetical protein
MRGSPTFAKTLWNTRRSKSDFQSGLPPSLQEVPAWPQMDATTMEHWWTALTRRQQWYGTEDAKDQDQQV